MNEIRTGPYNIEVADPSFCGELGEGSETYVFDSYAEVIAFRVGLEASGGEYKIVVRHKDGLWSYEDDEDDKEAIELELDEQFLGICKQMLDETSKRDLMDTAMSLLDVFWNLPEDDLRKSDFLPNYGIAAVRDRMAVAANLCYQTWSVMVQRDELIFYGGDFDWDFCPRFFENCMDDQMVLKSGEVHDLIKMWKGEKNELRG